MDNHQIQELIRKCAAGDCTEQERQLLEQALLDVEHSEATQFADQLEDMSALTQQRILQSAEEIPVHSRRRPRLLFWSAAAASILMVAGAAVYLINKNINQAPLPQPQDFVVTDIDPGTNKAVLITAGKTVDLTSAGIGRLNESGASKTAEGQLVYDQQPASESAAMNTIRVPRAGQYHVTLSDGTKVWLNAASSISFPTKFTGADRSVSITGECYFEVNPNKLLPFIVKSPKQEILVLGTHFNVNAYEDEMATTTTLVEGKVRVTSNGISQTIMPGSQVVNRGGKLTARNVDTDRITAWKDGKMYFKGADIYEIMRQISRWYNLDVQYEGNISTETFNAAAVSRKWKLSTVMEVLAGNGIHTKIVPSPSGLHTLIVSMK